MPWYTLPPKKKAHKVRHVDGVIALEHGHRKRQERERSVTLDGGEIDEVAVADKIYARIARAVRVVNVGGRVALLGSFIKKKPSYF